MSANNELWKGSVSGRNCLLCHSCIILVLGLVVAVGKIIINNFMRHTWRWLKTPRSSHFRSGLTFLMYIESAACLWWFSSACSSCYHKKHFSLVSLRIAFPQGATTFIQFVLYYRYKRYKYIAIIILY